MILAAAVRVSHPTGVLRGRVTLPASKSEANRALIIRALSGKDFPIHNLSDANDTQLLNRLLSAPVGEEVSAEDAGTVMRFLTAYYAATGQELTLTGTARMCQRPIGVLVDALRQLGAQIDYLGQEGFPPLRMKGFTPSGSNQLTVRSDISSQYISALLMIGPLLPQGLELTLEGKISSEPYIRMTLAQMAYFGVEATFEGQKITVDKQEYQAREYTVESDWSAASYWFSITALAKEADLFLPALRHDSLQGDSVLPTLMAPFGVETEFTPEGVRLTKQPVQEPLERINFYACPDLAQTVAALAAGLEVEVEMTGLESLRIKETDRIAALQFELVKFGAELREIAPDVFKVFLRKQPENLATVHTYEDHRMAMAFAPLALKQPLVVEEPKVVRKSYPRYWEELEKAGFEIEKMG
ncbi:3-phosphoshikimate 1-carboxyvinyltransferase [Rufibacter glacialis]|uniref:3-phosphoshikimate 1-carboxyvinyltransferase n=1 Tax=Rufibacter glacialis TaxID=1259555 RepID=A0A5M8QNL7_9BACT|nr:3-phosphoshikimate 1-carboxyvinyltransferase [Rufibacter glacialis]KAA6435782.1 3-phosphoshikimate 1-carboxyvinyltransferase [Rufibacter glacialis]GGK66517.1 3-phosphoshikimate 1-carboxyvinyltransferase [Rufibacter glacialis]